MAESFIDATALGRIGKRLARLAPISYDDAKPLLERFEDIIKEDNRKGILSGLDRNDVPFIEVTYRNGLAIRTAARKGVAFGSMLGTHKGSGHPSNGNLSSSEYRKLTGPPLAPRRDQSRIITNMKTANGQDDDDTFAAVGGWDDFVAKDGRPILPWHFSGPDHNKRLPIRDAAGVRKWGVNQAIKATRQWAKWLLSRQA